MKLMYQMIQIMHQLSNIPSSPFSYSFFSYKDGKIPINTSLMKYLIC